ncbi:MAG: transcriptional repressor [Candidatus Cloacimonetes bacterium]|nr:transcriptional repressor [Candidatus Cloacimonadota bacterium]
MKEYERLFTEYLEAKGQRLTQPRRLILEAVFSLHDHFDVEQLYDRLRIHNEEVSRATIYRTLPLLVESGLIQHSLRQADRDFYEHILGHPQHLHWICRKCGTVVETSLEMVLPHINKVASQQRFQIEDYQLNLRGLCWKCADNENENQ